jgi:hypothetical protein
MLQAQTHQFLICKTSLVEGGNSGESRDGSRDVGLRDERHDGDHGKTSVVEFTVLLYLHGIGRHSREVNWWENHGWQRASLGVVDILGFGSDLGDEDGGKDLSLSGIRDGSPSIDWLHGGKVSEGDIVGEHSREVESSGVDKVTGGGNHGATAVLELSSTEPSKGLVGTNGGEAHRVESLKRGGASWHISKSSEGSGAGLFMVEGLERRRTSEYKTTNW